MVSGQKRKRSAGLDVPGVIVGAVVDAIARTVPPVAVAVGNERSDEAAAAKNLLQKEEKKAGERIVESSKEGTPKKAKQGEVFYIPVVW